MPHPSPLSKRHPPFFTQPGVYKNASLCMFDPTWHPTKRFPCILHWTKFSCALPNMLHQTTVLVSVPSKFGRGNGPWTEVLLVGAPCSEGKHWQDSALCSSRHACTCWTLGGLDPCCLKFFFCGICRDGCQFLWQIQVSRVAIINSGASGAKQHQVTTHIWKKTLDCTAKKSSHIQRPVYKFGL